MTDSTPTPKHQPRRPPYERSVLILTNSRDYAADRVVDRLRGLDIAVERWHLDTQPGSRPPDVAWSPLKPPASSRFTSIWLRQFLPELGTRLDVGEADDQLVTREQWRTWLTDLAEEPHARWLNPLWASRRAENKLVQLRTACNLGLRTPATLVTNSRVRAEHFEREVGPCVVKTPASAYHALSDGSFVFTRPLADALQASAADWQHQPLVVQQRITPRTDVRVFVLDDLVTSAAADVGDATDWRTEAGNAQWSKFAISEAYKDMCRSFVRELGLVYGALDFAFDGNDLWFLECNQAGEFAFADTPLALGIAEAIARWLAR